MKEALDSLIRISKYSGERFDLVQAGGGNSSVKLEDGRMIIKSSGISLSEVSHNKGYTTVDNEGIKNILGNKIILNTKDKKQREALASQLVKEATEPNMERPSIETLLHSILLKYTLHTHSLQVNMIVARKDWDIILKDLFKDVVLVDYQTPGIELAMELKQNLKRNSKIIFLQNHGLIVTSNCEEDIKQLTEEVVLKIEAFLKLDFSRYRLPTRLRETFKNFKIYQNKVAYLSEDVVLNNINPKSLSVKPFFPDKMVFCGIEAVKMKNEKDLEPVSIYLKRHGVFPNVLLVENVIICIGESIKKAKETEEVLKLHAMVSEQIESSNLNVLEDSETTYLVNWEAEKYRQKV